MSRPDAWPEALERLERRALQAGLAAAAVMLIGLIHPERFFRSYLFAYLLVLGIPLGCMALAMVHTLVGGAWGLVLRRFQEAAFATLPLVAVLWLPLIVGMYWLYPWADDEAVAHHAVLQHRSAVFNVPMVVVRAFVYFGLWIATAWWLQHWSAVYEHDPTEPNRRRLQKLSAAGLLVYALTMTFASFDWIMSREAHWYSTIFGLLLVVGQVLSGYAFAMLLALCFVRKPPLARAVQPGHLNDLGTILLVLVILFAYLAFSQYLIIWSGHLQEEITWYVARSRGGWQYVAAALLILHFFVPFFALLSRHNKQAPQILAGIAVLLLAMRWLDVLWMVAPSSSEPTEPGGLYWTDLVATVALGGLWLKVYLWSLRGRPLLIRQQPGAEISVYDGTAPGSIS